ncbi:TOBE domain-containing protein [Pseudomaricurvus sp. HS19]|uniref:TOBE domain-containing protein n=1 Tax=Pseudomaricurvus sp. HS19 TaxID=2692626 RepID=UPI00136F1408|nr:TOBE domain-containing protein [Pseudomaricurvus sp. HS19]MYM62496.1 LysR family transcriptional regulator [Pseudomaricurvus sp. HS19]
MSEKKPTVTPAGRPPATGQIVATGASASLSASLTLAGQGHNQLAAEQVRLLEAIQTAGSISGAARIIGVSYKTAWDRIDTMNNMAASALVERSAGGSQGGGTRLTPFAGQLIQGFRAMESEHQAYLQRLGQAVHSLEDVAGFMQLGTIKTSARNQYRGVVTSVEPGAVNAALTLAISDTQQIHVIVTEASRKEMQLEPGRVVVALVKSSSVMLSTSAQMMISARNRLQGRILRINPGAVNCEVAIDIGGSKTILAVITNDSVGTMGLTEGDEVCAFFKASSVILLAD